MAHPHGRKSPVRHKDRRCKGQGREEPTVLDELIDSVLMKFSKKHPNQKVITQIPDEFVDIPMDSLLIEQVLLNLLENAVFHAKGMTELMLSVSLVGDKAVFEVADNGCGIPEDALQKIFSGAMKSPPRRWTGHAAIWGSDCLCAPPSSRHTAVTLPQKKKGRRCGIPLCAGKRG